MTAIDQRAAFDRLDGVRRKRILAFVVDFVIVSLISLLLGTIVIVLGFLTFGLAWLLLGSLFPIVAIIYCGSGVGSDRHATIGMATAGLVFRLDDGSEPTFLFGAVHVILFYLSVSFLTPLVLLVSLFNTRKRLLHDMILGAVIEAR